MSHLCIFTRTELGMYLKIGKMARGPTLTFKVHSFTLAKDVVSSLKKQFVYSECFKHSPLVVLNNFSGEGMHMKLMASTFQNMFPTLNLTNVCTSNELCSYTYHILQILIADQFKYNKALCFIKL